MNTLKAAWILPLLSVGLQLPPDSTETRFGYSGGGGNYSFITRDCSGNAVRATEIPFAASSGSIEQQISDVIWIGARIESFKRKKIREYDQVATYNREIEDFDYVTVDRSTGTVLVSYVALEGKNAGIAAGIMHPTKKFTLGKVSFERNQPCGRVRLGRLDRWHVEGSYGFNTPLVAGGGFIDLGLGYPIDHAGGRIWFGVDAGPYEASGLLVKLNTRIAKGFYLTGTGRLGSAGGVATERAVSVGFTYRWKH